MAADLSGRAALITGAASGIGRASALAFASAGASVALLDIDAGGLADTAAAVRAAGARAEVLVADVRDLRAVTGAVGRAVEAFGRLDAALNNAGVPGPYVPLDEYSEEDFMRILQVDLAGVWRCMRAEIRYMRARGTGAIVNTSSMLGAAAMPDNGAYVAAKHGVHGLTRAAAVELGGAGIRVNAIAPGVTRTGMTSAASDDLLRTVPLGRIAEPEEIATAAVWLVLARSLLHHRVRAGRRRRLARRVSGATMNLRHSTAQPHPAEPVSQPALRRELRFLETAFGLGRRHGAHARDVGHRSRGRRRTRPGRPAGLRGRRPGRRTRGLRVRPAGRRVQPRRVGLRLRRQHPWSPAGVPGRVGAARHVPGVPPVSIMGVAIFGRAFLSATGLAHDADWYPLAFAAWVVIWVLAARGVRPTTRSVLAFEVVSVCLILVLMGAICWRLAAGTAPGGQGWSGAVFVLPPGVGLSALTLAATSGFLAFAGFESAGCAEEKSPSCPGA